MAKRNATAGKAGRQKKSALQLAVQEAGSITGRLLGDLQACRRRTGKTETGDRELLAALRALRKRSAKSASVSVRKVLPDLDHAIGAMENDAVVETAGLGILDRWISRSDRTEFFSYSMTIA